MNTRIPQSLLIAIILAVTGCAGKKQPPTVAQQAATTSTAGQPSGPSRGSARQRILKTALQEWEFFGRQTVRLDGNEESIPHVGKWEDDGDPWSTRVNWYWSAVGKPGLDGFDCKEPWSAAFISWVMRQAGLSSSQFPPADAHWNYIRYFIDHAAYSDAAFFSHRITEYPPKPGDLICATRGNHGFIPVYDMPPSAVLGGHAKLHCDIVVEHNGATLGSIGGNVRNSVTKTFITLKPNGLLQPTERRPWFVVLENRLGP
jgi:hypothetical protein